MAGDRLVSIVGTYDDPDAAYSVLSEAGGKDAGKLTGVCDNHCTVFSFDDGSWAFLVWKKGCKAAVTACWGTPGVGGSE